MMSMRALSGFLIEIFYFSMGFYYLREVGSVFYMRLTININMNSSVFQNCIMNKVLD